MHGTYVTVDMKNITQLRPTLITLLYDDRKRIDTVFQLNNIDRLP